MGSYMSLTISPQNLHYNQVFLDACHSGDTTHLERLIAEKKFQVNEFLQDRLPLTVAIEERSKPVVVLLLDNGADLTFWDEWPLNKAVLQQDLEMVQLLLIRGANPAASDTKLLASAVDSGKLELVGLLLARGSQLKFMSYIEALKKGIETARPENIEILKLLLEYTMNQFSNSSEEMQENLGKYSRLCLAIVQQNGQKVIQLLTVGDYETYMQVLGKKHLPAIMAWKFGGREVVKAFVKVRTSDLKKIYWRAAKAGDVEVIELCLSNQGFNSRIRNSKRETALHLACRSNQLEVAKILVQRCGLQLEGSASLAHPPIFNVWDSRMLRGLLAAFPETNLNVKVNQGYYLLRDKTSDCQLYTILLEYGADPEVGSLRDHPTNTHRCNRNCPVIEHLQKMHLIDQKYVDRIFRWTMDMTSKEFKKLQSPFKLGYEAELEILKSQRISQSTSSMPGKTLFDFIFLEPNEAARYSRNALILNLYKKNQDDFENCFPHYGFALNYQLRRGMVRCQIFDWAEKLLGTAFGRGVPEEFVSLIFGNFSNRTLKKFYDQGDIFH